MSSGSFTDVAPFACDAVALGPTPPHRHALAPTSLRALTPSTHSPANLVRSAPKAAAPQRAADTRHRPSLHRRGRNGRGAGHLRWGSRVGSPRKRHAICACTCHGQLSCEASSHSFVAAAPCLQFVLAAWPRQLRHCCACCCQQGCGWKLECVLVIAAPLGRVIPAGLVSLFEVIAGAESLDASRIALAVPMWHRSGGMACLKAWRAKCESWLGEQRGM